MPTFTQTQLEAIAGALGDTPGGLTEGEIPALFEMAGIPDPDAGLDTRQRLFNAFADVQTTRNDRTHILAFICTAMRPERFARDPERFEAMRDSVNRALALAGLTVSVEGKLEAMRTASKLSEATRRARELRADLTYRDAHPEVMRFCQQELLADGYFLAVQEAIMGLADKIRRRTGLDGDGADLVDEAFAGAPPLLAINALTCEGLIGEQKGFAALLKGVFGLVQAPSEAEARPHWHMTREDAEDLLCLVSLIHRRLDTASTPQVM
ncbi:TIGR02391 family protein [Pleomorphomonas sp. JP5]|uniref:TIGR02391 family protein n=1 Tax=Pleomorphomonas sp. JP5 TaxID=2942998 RepID=UPI0020443F25|nr:TIGR02391 family protein [Pleomorphomonas sp. JP5]MCM5557437.1 TIGR02391 family protein [Pleomorphomonas sp. JP5]